VDYWENKKEGIVESTIVDETKKEESTESKVTLESEVREFVKNLPYWEKFLGIKVLASGKELNEDLVTSLSYLLEDYGLKEKPERDEIEITSVEANDLEFKADLQLQKLEEVVGVNALVGAQTLEFSPNLSVIYGRNGSGKSGYVRLLKQAFYSKVPEDILQNIYSTEEAPQINAKFIFLADSKSYPLYFASDLGETEFQQFAVFDNLSVIKQIDEKNNFSFQPAGLRFFEDFSEAIQKVENIFNDEVNANTPQNTIEDFLSIYDGESEITDFIKGIDSSTELKALEKYIPYTEEEKMELVKVEKEYDDLALGLRDKENKTKEYAAIRGFLLANKTTIETLNASFTAEKISEISTVLKNYIETERLAKREGIERFNTEKILLTGSKEWKEFIQAADEFARLQKPEDETYPTAGDNCIFCLQPLSNEAQNLIKSYWDYLQSSAENEYKQALTALYDKINAYQNLNFDVYNSNSALTIWLEANHPKDLEKIKLQLQRQKELCTLIIEDLKNRIARAYDESIITTSIHDSILSDIDQAILSLSGGAEQDELVRLLTRKRSLSHKAKYQNHHSKYSDYLSKIKWIEKSKKVNWAAIKKQITMQGKYLYGKYYNQTYLSYFNEECKNLHGQFQIEINYTGEGGASFRQLKLKGNQPSDILSEGEQKVIALADFLSEMRMSNINRGLIFDDPVNSLDDYRKKNIAQRLAKESATKQVVVFTHDLIFVSQLIMFCQDHKLNHACHWIESNDSNAGFVYLNNSPSYEAEYRNAEKVKEQYNIAKKPECTPAVREEKMKSGFAKLRTCYEVLVINELFNNVVQRFEERVSIDRLKDVAFDDEIRNELLTNYAECCRYMEGHSHSDAYAYQKPEVENLNEEIQKYEAIRGKIRSFKKKQK
jgi:energy-coupling factor transporter ATP-binding protein EcfA2